LEAKHFGKILVLKRMPTFKHPFTILPSGFPLAIAIVANGDKFEKMALTFQIWRFSNHLTEI